ncbi:MAG: DUF308 domain-containing protein [Clostridiales bacterium]|nr:DUF308 domain-containing protein [Clostridiales bacterium]
MSKKMSNILISVMFLLLGIVLLIYRAGLESRIKLIVGIAIIVLGVFRIITALIKNKDEDAKSTTIGDFIVGLILIAFGIIILVLDMAFAIVIGAFFIFAGIRRLLYSIKTFDKNPGWVIAFIIAILITGMGVFFIIKNDFAIKTVIILVGITLIVLGIQGIIAVLFRKKKNKKVAEKTEKPEKTSK